MIGNGHMNGGGRRREWLRNLKMWKYYADYFPMKLHKTVDLSPEQNYILGYHPHGIVTLGAIGNFTTNGTGFSTIFPGMCSTLITLNINFLFPFFREIVLSRGFCSANRESIEYLLTKKGKGNMIVIVVGGAVESMDAVPNTMKLTLRNRKGFVRIALSTGAHLIPVISFGENEIYKKEPRTDQSLLKRIQRKIYKITRVAPPLSTSRYFIGALPFRKPINTIVGAPIPVEKVENPSEEQVDHLHQRYIDELTSLFEKHKAEFAEKKDIQIEI